MKKWIKFSRLFTVRAMRADPPPYGHPDRKISFFDDFPEPKYFKSTLQNAKQYSFVISCFVEDLVGQPPNIGHLTRSVLR